MRITYYALKEIQVGPDTRQPGDLVPEARDWRWLSAEMNEGKVAPVLVATLPEDTQRMLLDWDAAQRGEQTTDAPKRKSKSTEKVA